MFELLKRSNCGLFSVIMGVIKFYDLRTGDAKVKRETRSCNRLALGRDVLQTIQKSAKDTVVDNDGNRHHRQRHAGSHRNCDCSSSRNKSSVIIIFKLNLFYFSFLVFFLFFFLFKIIHTNVSSICCLICILNYKNHVVFQSSYLGRSSYHSG